MKKIKDLCWLLFWGILCGAFFVGCILGFMALWNYVVKMHTFTAIPAGLPKLLLVAVIIGGITLIFKTALPFYNKIVWKQAQQVFPPQLIEFIKAAPLAKAVVEQREDIIDQLRFLPKHAQAQTVNAPIDPSGLTALHIAAALDLTKFCKYLLKYGANLNRKDIKGHTALDWARIHQAHNTEKYLTCMTKNPAKH